MKFTESKLPGVITIEPQVFGDSRGFFMETFHLEKFREAGIDETFVQDNHSRSAKGVLRGLHYQLKKPQGKLVRVTRGAVYDVAVDIRRSSPFFGQWYGCELTEENKKMLYIPPGFAHGFCVLSELADFQYSCTNLYDPSDDRGILWSDPKIGVKWPIDEPLLSDKDRGLKALEEVSGEELPE